MWDTIEHILLSPNATRILLFLSFITVIVLMSSKNGLLHIQTNSIQIGAATLEREIIRRQIEWIKNYTEGKVETLNIPDEANEWKVRYVSEKVYDEYVDWITFNHINLEEDYVEIKQDKIINLVHKHASHPYFLSKEFEKDIKDDVVHCLKRLIQIRTLYTDDKK